MDTLSSESRPALLAPSRSEPHPQASGEADGLAPERGIGLAGQREVEERLEVQIDDEELELEPARSAEIPDGRARCDLHWEGQAGVQEEWEVQRDARADVNAGVRVVDV